MADDPRDESVLVVHGIANRDRRAFEGDLLRLTEVLAPRRVVPVFWGDLGPRGTDAFACLPDLALESAVIAGPARATVADDLLLATIRRVEERAGEHVPGSTRTVLRQAVEGWTRRRDPGPVADVLAETVLVTGPEGRAAVLDDDDDDDGGADGPAGAGARRLAAIGARLRSVVAAVDAGVEGWSQSVLSDLVRDRAIGLSTVVARTVGDVLTYERHGDVIRGRLDAAYREARATSRVHLLAHSLGALIAVEWLLGAGVDGTDPTPPGERHLAKVVTFGAQVSLFAELHGLLTSEGPTATTAPVALSARIERWSNVWHALDPLAFVMGPVLRLQGPGGEDLIEDLRLDPDGLGLSLTFHSSYWRDERFLAWLAATL